MIKPLNPGKVVVIAALLPLLYVSDLPRESPGGLALMPQAHAIVGAPVTPVSVAGVARRTTRRVVAAEATAVVATTSATSSQQAATAQQQAATAQQQATTAQQQATTA